MCKTKSKKRPPGIKELPSGRWQVRYRDPSGKQRKQSFTYLEEAKRFHREMHRQMDLGTFADPEKRKRPLSAAAADFLDDAYHVRRSTKIGYEAIIRSYINPYLGHVPVGNITLTKVRSWLAVLTKKFAVSTVAKCKRVLALILQQQVDDGVLRKNVAREVKVAKYTPRDLYLSVPQIKKLVMALPGDYRLPVLMACWTGVRAGELWALRVSDIDLVKGTVLVARSVSEAGGEHEVTATKSGKKRSVKVPPFLLELLAEHIGDRSVTEPNTPLFVRKDGGPVRHSNFRNRVFIPAVKAALPDLAGGLRFHDLRHTAATLWIEGGAHPKAVQMMLGHSSIAVTFDIYGHLLPGQDEGMAQTLDGLWRKSA